MKIIASEEISIRDLEDLLPRIPVVAEVHPLVPLCLPQGTRIIADAAELVTELDSPNIHQTSNILILDKHRSLSSRLPVFRCLKCPPANLVNERLPYNLYYARHQMLTISKLAKRIEQDVAVDLPDITVLFLVDGLGYWDIVEWPCEVEPCFVDGPSVTYRFRDRQKKAVAKDVGFPAIINRPSIADRLYKLGFRHARGYSYWNRYNNIADYMFEGIPLERVSNFEDVRSLLQDEPLRQGTFIQIVREGLDGLAHHKRELRQAAVSVTIKNILEDILILLELLGNSGFSVTVFLVADHGILWKTEHEFRILRYPGECKPRYSTNNPGKTLQEYVTKLEKANSEYFLLHYPYLGAPIRSNDSGVHGGLSLHESIVPYARFRG